MAPHEEKCYAWPMSVIGRKKEQDRFRHLVKAGRHVLIEGPVGVGKTHLAQEVVIGLGRKMVRVDGDGRLTEAKLTGQFDPARVVSGGMSPDSFLPGPLVQSMREGSILFINELNRLPESTQNLLLPVLDEGVLFIPHLGPVRAEPGFQLVATQNPREFVATSQLSEALLDRMEWMTLDYQSEEEEIEIVLSQNKGMPQDRAKACVTLIRETRQHPKLKRGASVRAAIALSKVLPTSPSAGGKVSDSLGDAGVSGISPLDWTDALTSTLATRVEFISQPASSREFERELSQLASDLLQRLVGQLKKKT